MHALIIGLGISGQAAANFLLRQGATVIAVDKNYELLQLTPRISALREAGMRIASDSAPLAMHLFDLVVVSPGVPKHHPLYAEALSRKIPVTSEIELAAHTLQGTVLGVTGTNGKTTVTALTTHILNACGKKAKALGNIGDPLTNALVSDDSSSKALKEIIVLELSSFQLETLRTPILDAAVVLNITPDHLDRYQDMTEYAKTKLQVASCLKPGGKLWMEQGCFEEYGSLLEKRNCCLYGYSSDCTIHTDLNAIYVEQEAALKLPSIHVGQATHDLENLMAAYALCRQIGISSQQFLDGYSTFQKPPHRIQFVEKINGIRYIDDSKGTNIDAVIRAVQAVQGPIILIAGGVDKGAAYTPWIKGFQGKVKSICAIGQARGKIKENVGHVIPVECLDNLEMATLHATHKAEPGSCVLLSPGCSSYDMFCDYADRGRQFQLIIRDKILKERTSTDSVAAPVGEIKQ